MSLYDFDILMRNILKIIILLVSKWKLSGEFKLESKIYKSVSQTCHANSEPSCGYIRIILLSNHLVCCHRARDAEIK